MGKPRAARIS